LMRDCEEIWLHPGIAEYRLELDDAHVAEVIAVTYYGRAVDPIVEANMDGVDQTWRSRTNNLVLGYYLPHPDTIRVYPIPSEQQPSALRVYYAAYPSFDATKLDAGLMTHWRDEIVSGALAELLMMPAQRWTNMELGAARAHFFEHGIARGRSVSRRAGTRQPATARMRPLA